VDFYAEPFERGLSWIRAERAKVVVASVRQQLKAFNKDMGREERKRM